MQEEEEEENATDRNCQIIQQRIDGNLKVSTRRSSLQPENLNKNLLNDQELCNEVLQALKRSKSSLS